MKSGRTPPPLLASLGYIFSDPNSCCGTSFPNNVVSCLLERSSVSGSLGLHHLVNGLGPYF